MKKKVIGVTIRFLIVISLMFAEYRYIIVNLNPYITDNETVCIEIFGQVDEYNVEK